MPHRTIVERPNARFRCWSLGALALGVMLTSSLLPGQTRNNTTEIGRDQQLQLIQELGDTLYDQLQATVRQRNGKSSAAAVSSELKAARPLLKSFAERTSQLTLELNDMSRTQPAVRTLVGRSRLVAAQGAAVHRLANQYTDHRWLAEETQQLDADWSSLAFRLQQQSEFQKETAANRLALKSIAAINGIAGQVKSSLAFTSTVNRRPMILMVSTLLRDLDVLAEDVRSEFGRSAESQQIGSSVNQARQHAGLLADDIADYGQALAALQAEYRRFESTWMSAMLMIQKQNNRTLDRDLRRVMQSMTELRQLLQLTQANSREELLFVSESLRKEIDRFFHQVPLYELIQLPRANQCLAAADEFYGVCENFLDVVNRKSSAADAVDAFRYVEESQESFLTIFSAVNDPDSLATLQRIDQSINTLGVLLSAGRERFSRSTALELTSKSQGIVSEMNRAAKVWLNRDKPAFAGQCTTELARLEQQLADLQRRLATNASSSSLRGSAEQIYETYRTVYSFLVQCQSQERAALGRMASNLTPTLIELRLEIAR